MGLVLSIALSAGSRRGLVGKKGLPDMLRTLITLECAEDASFSAIAVDAGAPALTLTLALALTRTLTLTLTLTLTQP